MCPAVGQFKNSVVRDADDFNTRSALIDISYVAFP